MNYYRRFVGSYLKKTSSNSMLEDGAYTRLLDVYYATEKPLDPKKVNTTARAITPADRKAVASVVKEYFYLGDDGLLHNEKADEELGVAVPKLEKLREVARINGQKGGRPSKKTQSGYEKEPKPEPDQEPNPGPNRKQPSTVSHQPKPQKRFPDASSIPDSASTFGAAGLEGLKAMTLAEGKIPGGPDTPAAILAGILHANGLRGNAFHPLVVDWSREGVTPDALKAAIAKARQRPGKETGSFGPEYLDKIIHDETKPAAVVHAERAAKSSAHNVAKAQAIIAEQRKARELQSPMPEALRAFVKP